MSVCCLMDKCKTIILFCNMFVDKLIQQVEFIYKECSIKIQIHNPFV